MRKILLTTSAISAVAFASGKAAQTPPADTPASTETTETAATKERVAPELTAITTAVPMPEITVKRGSKSSYKFDELTTVGASFGVKNKTAVQIAAIISATNRKNMVAKKDASGAPVMKMVETKDANGNVVGRVPGTEPEMVAGKVFISADVDPKTDPDGASVRVWLKSLPAA